MAEDLSNSVSPTQTDSNHGRRKKRVRHWTASDRAKHRVFEKERREAFNSRLMELAQLLPSLEDSKESQLSKHIIVDESVKYHQTQASANRLLTENVEKLLTERQQLLEELNSFRQCIGLDPRQPLQLDDPETGAQTSSDHTASHMITTDVEFGVAGDAAQDLPSYNPLNPPLAALEPLQNDFLSEYLHTAEPSNDFSVAPSVMADAHYQPADFAMGSINPTQHPFRQQPQPITSNQRFGGADDNSWLEGIALPLFDSSSRRHENGSLEISMDDPARIL